MNVQILDTPDALAAGVAEWLAMLFADARGPIGVSLSGGSTPRALYGLLAAPPYLDRVPWDRLHLFFGDERFVPPGDSRSNYRMVTDAMLSKAPIPPANVHPVPTEGLSPQQAADAYAAELARFYGAATLDPARPLFEVTLLGLGANGHTASLFPGEPVLDDTAHWVAAVSPPGEPTRITMTYPAIDSSRQVAFLVAGAEKKEMLARLRAGDTGIPAGRVKPVGELHVFADRAAAG